LGSLVEKPSSQIFMRLLVKKITKKKLLFLVFVFGLGVTAFVLPVKATPIPWEFNYEFSGATAPEGKAPWLTATFIDGTNSDSDIVYLTMTATGLTDAEHVKAWYFNFCSGNSTTLSDLKFNIRTDGDFTPPTVSTGENAYQRGGGGKYDIEFLFPNSNDERFGVGDSLTVTIEGTGLVADWFACESAPQGRQPTFLSKAHIGGIGPEDASGWVAPVPEPATMLLLGSGLIGLAAVGRKKFFKKA
jgi:hypothetical protein